MEVSIDWVKTLRDLLVSSLQEKMLPLPVGEEICAEWRRGLQSEKSQRVLYTSCMYQIAPAMQKAVENLEKFGVTRGGLLSRAASVGARLAGGLVLRPSKEELERSNAILRSIYRLLKASGVEFGLLDKEPYSGALLYELGFVDEFAEYAKRVYQFFKERGVREVITVDPHTHNVLEKAYPQYVPGFDIRVVSYLDLVDVSKIKVKAKGFVIHDSCLYARHLGKYDRVRELLKAGSPVEDFFITGRETSGCCGGPIESIAPKLASRIAVDRATKLSKLSKTVVVACPICMVNLSRTGIVEVKDISEVLEA
ncbi:MAG: (Fe-S)-binding protein [Pyrobaculum sp.]